MLTNFVADQGVSPDTESCKGEGEDVMVPMQSVTKVGKGSVCIAKSHVYEDTLEVGQSYGKGISIGPATTCRTSMYLLGGLAFRRPRFSFPVWHSARSAQVLAATPTLIHNRVLLWL